MKKVLIVAYHFPPSNAVGALRPAKFAEYLPEFGWEPTVLTAPAEGVNGVVQFEADPAVPRDLVEPWPGLRQVAQAVARLRRGRGARPNQASASAADAGWREAYLRDAVNDSVLRNLVYSLMWLPDDRQGWIGPAVIQGLAAIRRERPDALLVTSPPHSAQVVGLALARLTGVPLVADFRDPWVGNPATPMFIRSGPTPHVHDLLESQVLHTAASVVTATAAHARALSSTRPEATGKITVIPNGFDAPAFEALPTEPVEPGRFTITYTGSFYHTRTPRPLLDAIGIIVREDGIDPGTFRVNLVGDCEFVGTEAVRDMAASAGCAESLVLPGRLPYRDALGELVRSDLLLLLAAGQPEQVPAKAYEYVAAGPPILALVEPGATADLLATTADADVLYDADPHRIAEVLRRRMAEGRSARQETWRLPSRAAACDRHTSTRKLASMLDELAAA